MSDSKRPRTLHDILAPIEERLAQKRRTRAMEKLSREMRLQQQQEAQWLESQHIDGRTRLLQEAIDRYCKTHGEPPSQRKLADITGINRKAIAKRMQFLKL